MRFQRVFSGIHLCTLHRSTNAHSQEIFPEVNTHLVFTIVGWSSALQNLQGRTSESALNLTKLVVQIKQSQCITL